MIETLEKPKIAEPLIYNREVRACHDATTWLAETLDGRMRTSFEYSFAENENELYADDNGALKPIFEKSLSDANELAMENPSLSFEKRRRQIELAEYYDMLKMASGELPNTMITVSDFPPELMDSGESVGGYNAVRQQTMLRVITRKPDGRLQMQSQSLDGSNRQALEAIYGGFGLKPASGELLGQRVYCEQDEIEQEFLAAKLIGVYDRSLEQQKPGRHYRAGRLLPDNPGQETYQFVQSQPDLVDYLTDKMLAGELNEQIMFSVAATMASRYEKSAKTPEYSNGQNYTGQPNFYSFLMQEMTQATSNARAENRTFSGCGVSVGGAGEMGADGQLEASGFGNKTDEDKYGSLDFDCPKCNKVNHRARNKLIPKCQHCGADVKC